MSSKSEKKTIIEQEIVAFINTFQQPSKIFFNFESGLSRQKAVHTMFIIYELLRCFNYYFIESNTFFVVKKGKKKEIILFVAKVYHLL